MPAPPPFVGDLLAWLSALPLPALVLGLAAAFLLAQAPWGAHPGHPPEDIQSGNGVVHNTFLLEKPEKVVVRGAFYPFPRSWVHGDFAFLPKPPWFVTNRTAHTTARRVANFALDPGYRHLPGIFASALRG